MRSRTRSAELVVGCLLAVLEVSAAPTGGAEEPQAPDPLAERGYTVTGGAAPGYVDDGVCEPCHADLYRSYREVGMARSFYRPRPENLVEDFGDGGFFHPPSRRHYEMVRRDGRLLMKRHQLDAEGEPINAVEQQVDWILGSGNHSRTYLFRTPGGELYQLPIAWYRETRSWGMAPGFDRPDHLGLLRRVRRECMFCHNAYPDVPARSDAHDAPHVYPEELPEGVGCQRCHGPGAEHSRVAMRQPVDFEALYATIVNPGDLEPRRRDDVCYGCHMQPSVAIPGVRRFGRHDYSFRPGEPLSDYQVQVDVSEAGKERGERFEINHHPYRLEQSPCFRASAGAMSCLTCHDPHRKIPESERVAHYRAACLGCHEVDACRLEEMAGALAASPRRGANAASAADPGDCAACHMPKRRTQDVVRVVMTDHLIRRQPGGPELLAPLAESDPVIEDVVMLDPARAPGGKLVEIYRAVTVIEVSSGALAAAVDRLERLLPEVRPPELEPWLALARGQLRQQRPEVVRTLQDIVGRSPSHPLARELLGVAWSGFGETKKAVAQILSALEAGPDRPEARFNLGVFLSRDGRPAEALLHLERAVEMRPNMAPAWFYLGKVQGEMGDHAAAVDSYRRTLALDPTRSRAYLALGRLLTRRGDRAGALRVWRHGAEHAARPEAIVEALASAEKASRAGR